MLLVSNPYNNHDLNDPSIHTATTSTLARVARRLQLPVVQRWKLNGDQAVTNFAATKGGAK